MKSLHFAPVARAGQSAGKPVRLARFEARSSLPVSAACVVANGVRESLTALLGVSVVLRLLEPTIPPPHAWSVILRQARCYRIRGSVADAAIVFRPADAVALAATLFGEPRPRKTARELSPIEGDVLDRLVGALAANLAAVCGSRDGRAPERVATLPGFITYFELMIEDPVAARIGIALSREPSPESAGSLETRHLAAIRLALDARLHAGMAEASSIAQLVVGAILPLDALATQRCTLTANGQRVARGSCGVRSGRYAFSIDAIRETL